MAITVQYGPISSALGLAQVAGQGQGFQIQSQRDLQALQLQNQMQAEIDQRNANTIQMANAQSDLQARMNQQQQQDHQNDIYRQTSLQLQQQQQAQQNSQFQAQQATRDKEAKTLEDQRTQAANEKKMRDDWLNSLPPDQRNIVLSGGHLPNALETQKVKDEQKRAATDAATKQAEQLHNYIGALTQSLDPTKSTLTDEERVATVAKLKSAMAQYSTTIDGINAATGSGSIAPPAANGPQATPDELEMARRAVGNDPKQMATWLMQNLPAIRQKKASAGPPPIQQAPAPQQQAGPGPLEQQGTVPYSTGF